MKQNGKMLTLSGMYIVICSVLYLTVFKKYICIFHIFKEEWISSRHASSAMTFLIHIKYLKAFNAINIDYLNFRTVVLFIRLYLTMNTTSYTLCACSSAIEIAASCCDVGEQYLPGVQQSTLHTPRIFRNCLPVLVVCEIRELFVGQHFSFSICR